MVEITEPGIYELEDDVYHADPVPDWSLSSSGARRLLPPSCPAKYLHERENGRPPKATFDFGHAAHKVVLGVGPNLVLVDRPRWDTNDVKAEVAKIRAAGDVPLKRDEYETVHAMAAALRRHPIAAALLDPEHGMPEQSLFWQDRTGVWCRCRLDWLPDNVSSAGRLLIPDYKTALSADEDDFRKSAASYGYHQQAAWNIAAVKALGLADDAAFLFVVQEKTPPYLVNVIELDTTALAIGNLRNRQAIGIFRDCLQLGDWPGYYPEVHLVGLPPWVERQYENEDIYV